MYKNKRSMSQSGSSSCWKLENEISCSHGDLGEGVGRTSNSMDLTRKPPTSTRVSLLVEALIRSVVAAYETDSRRVARTYRRICRRLFRMGLIDESWSMAELEGARAQFEHTLLQLMGTGPDKSPSLPLLWPGSDSNSQFKREFDEIKCIGGGGFGKVFQVKHKLDGTEYAVKKISIYSEDVNSVKTYLSEVKTFASMNHQNIVQYKAAWLEIGSPLDAEPLSEPHWSKPKITIPSSDCEHFIFNKSVSNSCAFNNGESNSTFEIAFEGSRDCINDSENSASSEGKNSSEDAKALVLQENIPLRPRIRWATLYIQMSLCHGTLYQWLRRRNETFDPEIAITYNAAQAFKTKALKEILMQILKGLSYIHSRGVVHHDIKPSNIFVSAHSGSLLVQLGDFGLACPLQCARHCFARGTPLYAAPEQLAGHCNPKSDMYSLGIVLFELQEDFSTEMERTKRISELRGRTSPPIPQDLELNNLVTALVRRRPEERPDALTLLRSLETGLDDTTSQVEALKERLSEKDREIRRLTELLRKHGIEGV